MPIQYSHTICTVHNSELTTQNSNRVYMHAHTHTRTHTHTHHTHTHLGSVPHCVGGTSHQMGLWTSVLDEMVGEEPISVEGKLSHAGGKGIGEHTS